MNEKPFLSVVVVNWNGGERLGRCLAALRKDLESGSQEDVQVVIVDNGSKDDSLAVVRREMPSAEWVGLARNQGFASGVNQGIAVAGGKWIATLNNDVCVAAGWLAEMRQATMDCEAKCGMLQPCVMRADETLCIDTTGVYVGQGGVIEDRHRDERRDDVIAATEVFCPSASAAWYRRRMLNEMARDGNAFDPAYFMYYEDVDLGWRCRLAGWSAFYVHGAVSYHEGHASARFQAEDFVKRQCALNRMRVVLANGSARYLIRSIPRLVMDMAWLLRDAGPRAVAKIGQAIWDGLSARRTLPPASREARRRVESIWFVPR